MYKLGKKLSDEHKKKIGEASKRSWKNGVFDSERIRNIWREIALSGIAKKGKPSLNKFIPTQDMLDDYSEMGDNDLASKYGVSRRLIIKIRKDYSLPRFNNQHGTYPHEFKDGKEYKWCGSGHWELIENFGIHSSRYDGLRGHCKEHSNESSRRAKKKEYSTPEGKARMRKNNHKRKSGFILWEHEDELRAMELYQNRCGYCGNKVSFHTVEYDHFVPISKGGQTVPSNMIPSCVTCNRGVNGKKAKDAYTWLIQRFGEMGRKVFEYIMEKQSIIQEETKERVEMAMLEISID